MKKELKQKAAKLFENALTKEFPEFKLSKIKSKFLFGEAVFRWIVNDQIHVFILIVPNVKTDDEFVIEVGWSKLARFPELSCRPCIIVSPIPEEKSFPFAEYICRINQVSGTRHVWWKVNKSDSDVKEPDINNAYEAVKKYGIPFLKKIVEFSLCK
jgi:hypothetical protein